MKKILVAFIFLVLAVKPVLAASPHLVVNFAGINDLDWGISEDQWQTTVKPKIETQVRQMRQTLAPNRQSPNTPILAWSTLMEYMNFPMDIPSDQSIYAIKMHRILEIAQDLDFPVFVPLNGFQWWDQLPELYNWWDPDGTHTDPAFFARQKDQAEFKARFIAGYNPANRENVEWQSPTTPMMLNYRNWGGGGFRLAPPPNLLSPRFQSLEIARLKVILKEIETKRAQWESEGKSYLFAGLSLGTEVSLNASVTPKDEFKPYGYKAMQSLKASTSNTQSMTNDQLRTEALQAYFETMARFVGRSGIPKELIYTHVYGESDPGDSHYAAYADAAFNLYSNPGSSFYGHKDDPLGSRQWKSMLAKYGNPDWGAIEYSDTPTGTGLVKTLSHASLVDIYNWDSVQNNPASKSSIAQALSQPLSRDDCVVDHSQVHVQRGVTARLGDPEISLTDLPHGIYTQFTEIVCVSGKKIFSKPETFYVPLPPSSDTTPLWVKWILKLNSLFSTLNRTDN